MVDAYVDALQEDRFGTPPDDQAVDAFIESLGRKLSDQCPGAKVETDLAQGVTVRYDSPTTGSFAHLFVDFTCFDTYTVAVHARPEHLFKPFCKKGKGTRKHKVTLTTRDGTRFRDGSFDVDGDFDDGFGNFLWHFKFPDGEERITALAVFLADVCAETFEQAAV
jgi:hypothetical protein